MTYLAIKHLHVTFVVLSFVGFAARGLLMLADSPLSRTRVVKILPHVVDTGLLLSALALVFQLSPFPKDHAWLVAKVFGLILYIILGTYALRRGKTRAARALFWILAMVVFGWIVSVALTKNPWGFFAR